MLDDDGDVETNEGAQVGDAGAVRPHHLHRLPLAGDRGHDLLDAGVLAAGVGIHGGEQRGPLGEGLLGERVRVRVEARVGGAGRVARPPSAPGAHGRDGARRASQRRLRDLACVRVAGLLIEHGAQAEAERGVGARRADAALFEGDDLALPVFEEELAVVAAVQRVADDVLGVRPVEVGAGPVEEKGVGRVERMCLGHGPQRRLSEGWVNELGSTMLRVQGHERRREHADGDELVQCAEGSGHDEQQGRDA